MGLLDLPAPLFAALDDGMALVFPPAARLLLWAALAGAGTLLLYRWLSPQAAIGRAKREAREARQRLQEFDGEIGEAGPLIRGQFRAAFRHLGLVILPTLISMLPLLALLNWIDKAYSYDYPEANQAPSVNVVPAPFFAEWLGDGDTPVLRVRASGADALDIPVTAPVPVIERRHWWNWLVANPLGYLPDDFAVQRVEIGLPERSYLPFGPPWMRSWLALLLPGMLFVSLLTYRWARIE
ncbi:hypothetical protein [Pseudomonas indica]|uniref:DUF106 domain-containing protein n=1 Tax=Pseudomonas indica TaxID=137658 RepID=A0A1G9HFN6_9PSED|nr:hypothetical protein [Pseudomonas indica]PAU62061.1 hypothetical protein BZL42_06830 [Pseudomonas indica]SDL11712.1 hypothetical protein SAMN05216186_11526 [Pseudomonas indica]